MTWPTRAAASANNWIDHFSGSSLNARWGSVIGGSSTLTVTDSYCEIAGAANNSAFIYYNTKLDKTKSQLWQICMSLEAGALSINMVTVLNKATAPTADTAANMNVAQRMTLDMGSPTGGQATRMQYTPSGTTNTNYWDATSATWGGFGAGKYSVQPCRNSDYYVYGIEIDAANARFRWLQWGKTYTSGYTFEQGLRLFAVSDWVLFSAQDATDDLWLCIGQMPNNSAKTPTFRIEWVRYTEQGSAGLIDAWTASKAATANGHRIRHHRSYDGVTWVPEDRATDALAATGAGWESFELQAPMAVYDDAANTDYLFYAGANAAFTTWGIGVAKATHASPQNGPWTRGASNPLVSPSGSENQIRCPFAIKDMIETDSNKRWKMLFEAKDTASGKKSIHLATAPDPPDTSTWTRQGAVIAVGGSGSLDEGGAQTPVVVRYNGQWEVYYEGWDASGNTSILRATGTDLASLTKDGVNYWAPQASGTTTLTANLTGRTVTVASTAGFTQDGFVVLDQDATLDNYGTSRVRKVTDSTHLELYHGLDGFVSATPAKIRQLDAIKRYSIRAIVQVGGQWWFYVTFWEPFADDATFRALLEQNVLLTHSNVAPSGGTLALDHLTAPVTSRGYNNDLRSAENMGLLNGPTRDVQLGAAIASASATAATLTDRKALIAAIASASTMAVALGTQQRLAATIACTSALAAGFGIQKRLAASVVSASFMTAALTVSTLPPINLSAMIGAASLLAATLSGGTSASLAVSAAGSDSAVGSATASDSEG